MKIIIENALRIVCLILTSTFISAKSEAGPIINIDKQNITFGGNITYNNSVAFSFKNGYLFSTSLVLTKKHNVLSLGPMWWIDKNKKVNLFRGGIISYHFFPYCEKKLKFCFVYDLIYNFEINKWNKDMNYEPGIMYNVDYKDKWQSIKNQVGYGFQWNFYKGLYLYNIFSLGIEFYSYSSKTIVLGKPELSYVYANNNIFANNQICNVLKFGIGYNFE